MISFKDAIAIQDACNPVAVARIFAECVKEDREMIHPCTILLLSKLASMIPYTVDPLGGVTGVDGENVFSAAYTLALSEAERGTA